MSIIFGVFRPENAMVTERELLHASLPTERYAERTLLAVAPRIGMGFQPCCTHERSKLERGPARDSNGNLLCFDGRLDNYRELSQQLGLDAVGTADSEIVMASYRQWGEACFSKLIGDWAIALWSFRTTSLYLARDHAGTRTLYFQDNQGTIRWSTYLETFHADGALQRLEEEYAACYLASLPIRDLTPFKGIKAVLPAHYIVIHDGNILQKPHWNWVVDDRVHYRKDCEYEEHFLELFEQSVERRTGPGTPILAQLSGGIDSSSIVCTADCLRRSRNSSAEILDTVSFYDDAASTWNEKPYFTAVETSRGKAGVHIATSFRERTFAPHDSSHGTYFLPGADSSTLARERRLLIPGYRVILSGAGGDEVLGGVPDALPELGDYLVSGNICRLLVKATDWCLVDRTALVLMLFKVVRYGFRSYFSRGIGETTIPPWVPQAQRRRLMERWKSDPACGLQWGHFPTAIDNGITWWSIIESLPHLFPRILSRQEYRYPYLDRDLVTYLFSIPREQHLRPGRRRSLMRRALKGIVPVEILERRRKAFQLHEPLKVLQQAKEDIDRLFSESLIVNYGLVELAPLRTVLDAVTKGNDPRWWQALTRVIAYELWLQAGSAHLRPVDSPLRKEKAMPVWSGANGIRVFRADS